MNEGNLYQERAENLTKEEFFKWGIFTEKDNQIAQKLISNSTKLLSGPRGSGKSMLMRLAYYTCFESDSVVLPIYANYEKYLYIEPILHERSNGNLIFSKWVLVKIIVESITTLHELEFANMESVLELQYKYFGADIKFLKNIVYELEGGTSNNSDLEDINKLTISVGSLLGYLKELLEITSRKRVILLLDDAAHAFSSNLQKEFFDIFRVLKSSYVSAKAAVYPGITNYSPYFNIGHDGLFIEVGYLPDNIDYIDFCDNLLIKRLGEERYKKLSKKRERIENIYYAANGIPRGIIIMAEHLLGDDENENTETKIIHEKDYYAAIDLWVDVISKFHSSLKHRMPRYSNFIDLGNEVLNYLLNKLKEHNMNKSSVEKAVFIGLSEPIPKELEKIINILEYSGLLVKIQDISKGNKGVYTRYMVHLGKIISSNTLAQGKRKTLAFSCESLNNINPRQFIRFKSESVLNKEMIDRCKFNLPPCPNCGKDRISEDAKFCAYCGNELKSVSLFYEIIEQDISMLPLSKKRIESIERDSSIRKIKDILMDENGTELKKVKRIQGYWAERIRNCAEEFIGG